MRGVQELLVNLSEVCGNGHDLTVEDAFVYSASGNRSCRQCAQVKRGKPKFRNDLAAINRWAG